MILSKPSEDTDYHFNNVMIENGGSKRENISVVFYFKIPVLQSKARAKMQNMMFQRILKIFLNTDSFLKINEQKLYQRFSPIELNKIF